MTLPDPTAQDPEVVRVLRNYRLALIQRETEQLNRLANAWLQVERKLEADMMALAVDSQKYIEAGATQQLIWKNERYKTLKAQLDQEMQKFTKGTVIPDIEAEQRAFGELGITAGTRAIQASFLTSAAIRFDVLPVDAIEAYVGLLGDGTPLNRLLKEAYPDALDGLMKSLLQGISEGLGPNQVARNMADQVGASALGRFTVIARTEQLRVYRTATTEQYRISGVVRGFKRLANKATACLACLVSDGEFFELETELEDHPNGKCALVPCLIGLPDPKWQTGLQWLESLNDQQQRQIMGGTRFDLWKSGQINLMDLRGPDHKSETWGNSPQVATIQDLINTAGGGEE